MKNKVLEGGINNIVYIWHSSEGSCKKCMELNGKEFLNKEDIPEKPHPNCKCYVEEKVIDDDQCDCADLYKELKELLKNFNILESVTDSEEFNIHKSIAKLRGFIKAISVQINILLPNYGNHLPDCEYFVDDDIEQMYAQKFEFEYLLNNLESFLNPMKTILDSIKFFIKNYAYLLSEKDGQMDKYYHSKANCEASQRGILGEAVATGLSDLKEFYDSYTYVHTHHVTIEERIEDSERDQIANREGRKRGMQNPTCDCGILMWDLRPKHRKYY